MAKKAAKKKMAAKRTAKKQTARRRVPGTASASPPEVTPGTSAARMAASRSPTKSDPYIEEYPPEDDTTVEYEEEMFRTYQHMGWKPEAFRDRAYGARYAAWLKNAPPDEA